MKGYGFLPAFPSAATTPAPLPRREIWRRYKRDSALVGGVTCGRCEVSTAHPAAEGWSYRRFSTPLFTEVRCKRCQKATGSGPADDPGGTNSNPEEAA